MRTIVYGTLSREARSVLVVWFARLWYGADGFEHKGGRALGIAAARRPVTP